MTDSLPTVQAPTVQTLTAQHKAEALLGPGETLRVHGQAVRVTSEAGVVRIFDFLTDQMMVTNSGSATYGMRLIPFDSLPLQAQAMAEVLRSLLTPAPLEPLVEAARTRLTAERDSRQRLPQPRRSTAAAHRP